MTAEMLTENPPSCLMQASWDNTPIATPCWGSNTTPTFGWVGAPQKYRSFFAPFTWLVRSQEKQ